MTVKEQLWTNGIEIDNGPNGDAWGSSMGALFGVAHALYHADQDIPADWQYRDALGCGGLHPDEDYEAIALAEAVSSGDLTWTDVRRIGNVLERYTRNLDRAGRAY